MWSYGDDVYEILARYLHLRERMRPYVRELMRRAHEHGDPVLRPLFYGHPDDPRSWTVDDACLFGPDLLVAPVVRPGAGSARSTCRRARRGPSCTRAARTTAAVPSPSRRRSPSSRFSPAPAPIAT